MGRTTGQMHPPAIQLDEENHIQSPQPSGFYREEIASKHLARIVGEKSRPITASICALGRWRHMFMFKNIPHCGAADPVAQLEQFAMPATIAPSRVFPSQAQQQGDQLRITFAASDKRLLSEGPLATDKFAMPFKNSAWLDQEQHLVQLRFGVLAESGKFGSEYS